MPEPVDAWWKRRQKSKGTPVPYPVGSYRGDWERYPVLIRQYHPDLNRGITLTQIPPAAEVFLQWQCEAGHVFVATPDEQRNRPGKQRRRSVWCPDCAALASPGRASRSRRRVSSAPLAGPQPGDAFWSSRAPKPASAAEADLRQRIGIAFEFDLESNAIAVTQQFFGRLEVWPDIVIPELRVAIEYDTVGRHGLEHVGPREKVDLRKDRAVRGVRWEVIRIRCGKLQPLGPFDLVASGVNNKLLARLTDRLAEIRGDLIVSAYRRRDP
jgi:hypothetical protein